MKERLVWADQAKAFAIFLMVLLHYGFPYKEGVDFVGMFHMPIFFFISGYFEKGNSFNIESVKKNFKNLMVPYFFFSVCAFTICWISPYLHPEIYNNDGLPRTFLKAFVGMFLMQDRVRPYAFMPYGPLWFLVALFEVKVLFSIFFGICKKYGTIIGLIFLLILFVAGIYLKIRYFSLDSAAMAIPIYYCGYLANNCNVIERVLKRWQSALFFIIGVLYLAFVGMSNGSVGMDGAEFGNSQIMFYINALIGSLTFIFLFKAMDVKWNWLSVVGASTLAILGTHFYIGILGKALGTLILSIDVSNASLLFVIILSMIGIAFGVGCNKLILKYIPWALGKNK